MADIANPETPPAEPAQKMDPPIDPQTALTTLVNKAFPYISSDLGDPVFVWSDWNMITGTFPSAQTEEAKINSYVKIRLESRAYEPSYIKSYNPAP